MAKARRPPARKRGASATRRKSAAKRSTRRSAKTKGYPKRGVVALKPVRALIERAIEGLRRLPPSDAIKLTIERLDRCLAEFNAICDPDDEFGCGPNMEFPREALALSRS